MYFFYIDSIIIKASVDGSVLVNKVTRTCEYCSESKCSEPTVIECSPPSEGKRNHCFALWKLEINGSISINMKVRLILYYGTVSYFIIMHEKTYHKQNYSWYLSL